MGQTTITSYDRPEPSEPDEPDDDMHEIRESVKAHTDLDVDDMTDDQVQAVENHLCGLYEGRLQLPDNFRYTAVYCRICGDMAGIEVRYWGHTEIDDKTVRTNTLHRHSEHNRQIGYTPDKTPAKELVGYGSNRITAPYCREHREAYMATQQAYMEGRKQERQFMGYDHAEYAHRWQLAWQRHIRKQGHRPL